MRQRFLFDFWQQASASVMVKQATLLYNIYAGETKKARFFTETMLVFLKPIGFFRFYWVFKKPIGFFRFFSKPKKPDNDNDQENDNEIDIETEIEIEIDIETDNEIVICIGEGR